MAGLLDIAPVEKRVLIPIEGGEHPVDVRGLTIADIRDLLARYPEVVGMFGKKLDAGLLMKAGPDVVASVIAAACGSPGKAGEAVALTLGAGVQAEILSIVMNLTMPRGPAPFLALLKAAGLDPADTRLSAAASPSSSNTSSPADTPAGKS